MKFSVYYLSIDAKSSNILYKPIYNAMHGLQKMYIISCYRRIKFKYINNLYENKDIKIRQNK